MPLYRRYALYYCPKHTSDFAKLGRDWLGWSIDFGRSVDAVAGPWSETPRRYGFHATLKAPFRLEPGLQEKDLINRINFVLPQLKPVELGALTLQRHHHVLALMPQTQTRALKELEKRCVTDLDDLRAPLTDDEKNRRKKAGLTERQAALLDRYGYPFVLNEFAFHMTLTSVLDEHQITLAEDRADLHFDSVLGQSVVIDSVCLVGERDDGYFELVKRFNLA